ncbi:uncharacterized protein CANTADRAFT_49196 [Suhomyces tanzawaensis NRRL Y-17324]|uniref:UDENN domain-containing protein n=1 Tax=Suhomyces tanzawaensis NRRL Y-17324 TaxID=984487 RepID=A0A1E4SJW2_9ASCO|nr:uncharacterized protein CANTADRAFT_49196 [Suhomyces tanzawaensis NRRL Y-17324]ODV79722.1 hypothetical protein CANTADRAFT_49196 [Suhomyces tanzawaensis NRRL Y-17324]
MDGDSSTRISPTSSRPDNEPVGLGIDTPTSESSPWADSPTRTTTTSITTPTRDPQEEFHIKPIRLAKRHHEKRLSISSASSTPAPSSPSRRSRGSRGLYGSMTGATAVETGSGTSATDRIHIKNLPISPNPVSIPKPDSSHDMIFAVGVVDFHHQRGPEVQWWKSNYHTEFSDGLFKNLSFQALPDGSHLFEETFSNFNLVYDFKSGKSIDDMKDLNQFQGDPRNLRTLFGCSCVRQVKTSDLSKEELDRNKDITRSIVQKAIVVIVRKQPIFNKIKEKLSIITKSYFEQDDFHNVSLLENLFENLNSNYKLVDNELEESPHNELLKEQKDLKEEEEFFVNLNLKNSILKFKTNFLIIFKALLLDKKIIIYSNNNLEVLTQFQNNLISLIPNLINSLDNSGCPLIDYIETNGPLSKPNSLNTTNRKSMLRFFGLPLQIFNTKSSFWNPYLPLQQLDELSVESYMIGCSNLLFINQAEKFKVDLVVNLDTDELTYPKTKPEEFSLSHNDKKFINNMISTMNNQEDDYIGNDDYIRYQFEDYLSSLIATMRYSQYADKFKQPPPGFANPDGTIPYGVGDIGLFNKKFIEVWKQSNNFKIWNIMADEFIFNFIDPKHLGVEISETNQTYKNISNFFNNFKLKTTVPQEDLEQGNRSKAQKFITDDNAKEGYETINETDAQKPNKKFSIWNTGWGFKKS